MATIELSLSKKTVQGSGKHEVMLRFFHGRKNLRAKTNIFVNVEYFEFYIDREQTSKLGVRVPGNAITCTMTTAEKAGYILRNSGEIVVKKRIESDDVKYHKEQLERIDGMKKAVMEAFEQSDKATISGDWLKAVVDKFNRPEKYAPKTEAKKTFFELGMEYLSKHNFSKSYVDSVKVLLRDVIRYEGYIQATENKGFTFDVGKVTRDDIEDFFDFLSNESDLAKEKPKIFARLIEHYPESERRKARAVHVQRGANSLIVLKKKMRALFVWMRESGYTNNRPMEDVRVGTERYGTPYYITIDERNKIADFDLAGRDALAVQRDIFIFQCLVGCRVSDLMKLTTDNINNGFLSYAPHKTKDEGQQVTVARVPLSAKAMDLIGKYNGKDEAGRLFPFISPQKYNEAIKEVFSAVGITRNVVVRNPKTGENELKPINEVASSHLARRTFIGNAYFKVTDPNIIGKMSGHAEGSKAFARYRNIEDETLINVINLIG